MTTYSSRDPAKIEIATKDSPAPKVEDKRINTSVDGFASVTTRGEQTAQSTTTNYAQATMKDNNPHVVWIGGMKTSRAAYEQTALRWQLPRGSKVFDPLPHLSPKL